ncbi:MAG: hypothetical protein LBQ60_15580 [Bacteroidales bacterium]|jgi:hypothetical protein|nr:hypothetical protein [Bacteroidales bacterium]
MDAALQLKIDLEKGQSYSESEILEKLFESELVKELTHDFPGKPLSLVWRLICISEVPFGHLLAYTKKLIDKVYASFSTPFGFSLSGDEKNFLPCYNAMIVSALCRLGRAKDQQVTSALNWIYENQPMERGIVVDLSEFRFDRFGGCFKNTPCYIGLAKSVIALQNYRKATSELKYDSKLRKGTDYMLQHKLFKRLSKDQPINQHITDISFPESYHLNVVELIRFVHDAKLLNDDRTKDLIDFLKSRQTKDGNWKINYKYKADGYTVFDKGRGVSKWTTYVIKWSLNME